MVTRTQLISAMLSIDNIDDNIYRSEGPHIGGIVGPNRLFGGYIAAQVYDAVRNYKNKINDEKVIFSMHYNFVSAGDPRKLIDIKVNQVEDIFVVDVYHENKSIGLAHIKIDSHFLKPPTYPENIPPLLSIPSLDKIMAVLPPSKRKEELRFFMKHFVFELRPVHMISSPGPGDYRVVYYARLAPECTDHVREDGGMVGVVALSDFFVLQSAQNAINEAGYKMATGASLHHKLYFHKEKVEAIQWFLVETRTEIATGNKAKIFGGVFDSTKECVVSFIQEAYVVPEKKPLDSKI
ncbi:Protein CBG22797 [Caenorhabditis briggsae]|uniref:Protein CBG22797 n=1 Tax=Caenorhabditis briggsae TaxID=6238 RepID=A8Y2W6_CAEBR|nr:Protein CBG22797 [Caenorhabditis briggsae]CAP39300.1 Protein CBG22797 [Caenorhabditis briggsae]